MQDPAEFTRILDRAVQIARRNHSEDGVGSAHLLLALVEICEETAQKLALLEVTRERILEHLDLESDSPHAVLPVDFQLNLKPENSRPNTNATNGEQDRILRIIDAARNRAREGLRVLEDYARFVCDHADASRLLKELRHELVDAEQLLPPATLRARNTESDVGTQITVPREILRESLTDVVLANCRRVQESLRTLEEFGKLLQPEFAARMKQLRYQSYELEQLLASDSLSVPVTDDSSNRHRRLQQASLYLLVTEKLCRLPWQEFVGQVLSTGIDVLQLREKELNDAELLRRARWIGAACRDVGTLFIVNDRPDIAVLADADGVHVGQDELPPADARTIIGSHRLLGVSTHDTQQATAAETAGADYLGVGPVFTSQTKQFTEYAGLDYVRAAARHVTIPWFAIGGITPDNIATLQQAGASRIAVTAAISQSDQPAAAVRQFREVLETPAR
ncbi:MAG: thiamine phosphate synthase [Planctomycetaceae bacterium]|nr:thiamine phosphate synthase [Planctomycetaceae bacterium]